MPDARTHVSLFAGIGATDIAAGHLGYRTTHNLRTDVAPGPLNPDWVEWLMGLPIGHTDPECAEPVQRDWLSEHDIPRTRAEVPHRKQRLMAIGNAQVWQVAYQRLALADRLLGA